MAHFFFLNECFLIAHVSELHRDKTKFGEQKNMSLWNERLKANIFLKKITLVKRQNYQPLFIYFFIKCWNVYNFYDDDRVKLQFQER